MILQVFLLSFVYEFCLAQCYDSAPGATCNVAGTPLRPNKIVVPGARAINALECFKLCDQYSTRFFFRCHSFSWNPNTQACVVYRAQLSSQLFTPNSSSPTIFWDRECFNCTEACSGPPNGQNVLGNPGFDQFNDSVLPWNAARGRQESPVLVSPGYHSQQAYEVNTVEPVQHRFIQSFRACPQGTYLVNFFTKAIIEGKANGAGFNVLSVDILRFAMPVPNNTWTEVKFYLHPASSGRKKPYFLDILSHLHHDSQSRLLYDQFSIVRTDPTASSSPSLLSNGGFENGLSPWTLSSPNGKTSQHCSVLDDGFESSHALQCTNIPFESYVDLQQPVTPTKNTTYLLSFDYKATYNTRSCIINYQWGPILYYGIFVEQNDTWVHFERALYATTRNTSLVIEINGSDKAENCIYYLDNISLVEAE